MHKYLPRYFQTLVLIVLGLGMLSMLTAGCKSIDRPRGPQRVNPKAEYAGLANQRVAILVSADDMVLAHHPDAPELVSRAVSARLAQTIPSIVLMSPAQLDTFQKRNPYWATLLPDNLSQMLDVDRLVMIDLSHFSTHEPGDRHLWQGLITAEVSVFENPPATANTPAYRTPVTASYPDRPSIGLVNSDEQTIIMASLNYFARTTAWLFYDAPKNGETNP